MLAQTLMAGRGENQLIALLVYADVEIRLEDTDERIKICGAEVSANMKRGERGIGNDDLAYIVAIKLCDHLRKRVTVEYQNLILPGELAGDAALRQHLEIHAAAA